MRDRIQNVVVFVVVSFIIVAVALLATRGLMRLSQLLN